MRYAAHQTGLNPSRWLVMNGDSYLAGRWLETLSSTDPFQAWMVARKVPDSGRYGRLDVQNGELLAFREKQGGGEGLINAGIYLLPSIWLNEEVKSEALSMEDDLFPRWLSEGRKIRVKVMESPFLDIGTPDDYARADAFFADLEGQT